jgi:exonuclease VII small subunit
MASLEEAMKRLERAVLRLEKASEQMGERGMAHNGALAAAKADYAALQQTTDSVAARLEAAILRLDRALEG